MSRHAKALQRAFERKRFPFATLLIQIQSHETLGMGFLGIDVGLSHMTAVHVQILAQPAGSETGYCVRKLQFMTLRAIGLGLHG